jgi:hypothetical protein
LCFEVHEVPRGAFGLCFEVHEVPRGAFGLCFEVHEVPRGAFGLCFEVHEVPRGAFGLCFEVHEVWPSRGLIILFTTSGSSRTPRPVGSSGRILIRSFSPLGGGHYKRRGGGIIYIYMCVYVCMHNWANERDEHPMLCNGRCAQFWRRQNTNPAR